MATFLELQDEMLQMVGRDGLGAAAPYRVRLKFYINRAYIAVCSAMDLPDLQKTQAAIPTVDGTQNYALASDCLFVQSVKDTTNDVRLEKLGIAGIDSQRALTADKDKPLYYARFANEIQLSPIPDAVYSIRVRYYSEPVELSADGDTPVIRAEWDQAILMLASQFISIATNRLETAEIFRNQFNAYVSALRIASHSLSLGADEGIDVIGEQIELIKRGAPGTVGALGTSAANTGR